MVANGEQGQNTPEARLQYEDTALAYLDSAELALGYAQSFLGQQYSRMIHPEVYENSGLSPQELEQATLLGQKVIENAVVSMESDRVKVPHRIKATGLLKRAVLGYQGINKEGIFDDDTPTLQPLDRGLPQAADELRAVVENAGLIIDREPYAGDRFTFVGLNIIKLAQFLSREDVQARVAQSPEYSQAFRRTGPIEQAALLVAGQLLSEFTGEHGNVVGTLVDALTHTGGPTAEQIAVINNAASDLEFVKQLLRHNDVVKGKINTFCSSIISEALSRGAANAHLLAQQQPDVEELHGSTDAVELVSREAEVVQAVRGIRRKAQVILAETQKVPDVWAGMDEVALSIFPDAESPIHDLIEKQETARRVAELAAAQAAQQETTAQNQAELAKLLRTYIVPRAKVKDHDYGKQISTMLVQGGDSRNRWEADLLGKADAFNVTGLLLALDGMLNERQNVSVFGSLFDAVQREDKLRQQIARNLPAETVGKQAAWIADNIMHLRQSSLTVLRRIGDGLAAYQLAQRTSDDPTTRPDRNVSIQTLHKVEELRSKAEQLDIRAFPPGRVGADTLVQDLSNTLRSSSANANRDIDELRLLVLDELTDFLLELGYQEQNIQIFRLKPGSLRQSVPCYALVLQLTDRKIIVAGNPKEPNATFVFDERDRQAATWEELIQLNEDDIKEFGGRGMRHDPESLDYHVERVKQEVTRRLTA